MRSGRKDTTSETFTKIFEVRREWLDTNGHMNNIEFVRLMQEMAVGHSNYVGCTAETEKMGAAWFVRSHFVEYRAPVFAEDELLIKTWIEGTDLLRSTRKYEFVRESDAKLVAEASTVWILVDKKTGRPKRIPKELVSMFF